MRSQVRGVFLVGLTGFEPATPWRFFGLTESLRKSLVFPGRMGNRAILLGLVYPVAGGPSRVIEMGI